MLDPNRNPDPDTYSDFRKNKKGLKYCIDKNNYISLFVPFLYRVALAPLGVHGTRNLQQREKRGLKLYI